MRLRTNALEAIAQHIEIDRLQDRLADIQIERFGRPQGFVHRRRIAAADDNDRHIAADAAKVLKYFNAAVLAERQIEADAIERGLECELCRLVVGPGSRRRVTSLGRDTANNLEVQIIVIDDKKTRQSGILRRLRGSSRAAAAHLRRGLATCWQ